MKKALFTLFLLATTGLVFSQQVDRQRVVMEIGTGTWCPYCPGAANGADDMVENGHSVAVIEYHNGDSYATTQSQARLDYYSISSFPTAKFDGTLTEVGGGGAGTSKYNDYLPLYNQRMDVLSSFTIDMCGDNTTGSTYEFMVTINKVADYTGSNLVVHAVITESHIPESWQGMSELNFVFRQMYPDQFGTSISMNTGDELELDYNINLDPSWDADECEFVIFIQDNTTKEILQGERVELNNMTGCAPEAAISCSDTSICVNGSTQFTDASSGNVVSREWNFEGGNPATSTDPNPTVTYNSSGYYNVELIVSDGTIYDTSLNTDWIEVKTDPAQCDKPEGTHHACDGMNNEYTIDPITFAEYYTWNVEPSSAGNISGSGTTGIFVPTEGYTGEFSIKVRAENECNTGAWSDTLQGTVTHSPTEYQLSQGGGFCDGSQGIELKLYGSDDDSDYELYLDGDPTGNIVSGTGDTISFGYQSDEGIYTCIGENQYCTRGMSGTAWVHTIDVPEQAEQPAGEDQACSNDTTTYISDGAPDADTLIWTIDPVEAGEIVEAMADSVTIAWNIEWSGTASVMVAGQNDCGTGPNSDPIDVTVMATPMPVVSGDTDVCDNEEYIYSTPLTEGNSYEWTVEGGTISAGAGTHEITVMWGEPGEGTVEVTETSAEGCTNASEPLTAIIDECTGIANQAVNELVVYPNPVTEELNIEFRLNRPVEYQVRMMNALGQTVYNSTYENKKAGQLIRIDMNSMPQGYYLVSIQTEDGNSMLKKVIKH